jgi:mannose-6-phosphate isomerase-like protein (cupin superfamily)
MKLPRIDTRTARIIAGIAVGMVVVGALLVWKANPAVAEIPAKLEVLAQNVTASIGDDRTWSPATAGMPLPVGTRLRTDTNGRAQITYFEGSTSRLETGTEIEITQTGQLKDAEGNTLIRMMQSAGSTWHRVKRLISSNSRYEIQTPTAVAAVRGTTFRADVRADGTTTFFVVEGSVSVQTASGIVVVEAGQKLTVPPGGKVTASDIQAITPADRDVWYVYNMGLDDQMTAVETGASTLPTPTPTPDTAGSGETSPGPSSVLPSPTPTPVRAPKRSGGGNRAPVLDAVSNATVYEGVLVAFTLSATDANGDTLSFSASGLPRGASLDASTGRFRWTPAYDQAGVYSVLFAVSDGRLTATRRAAITVRNVNRPPVFVPAATHSVTEGQLLSFVLAATDPDGDALTYGARGLPSGATFDPVARAFAWRPAYGQAGAYPVVLSVTDGVNIVERTVTITVLAFSPPITAGAITCWVNVANVTVAAMAPQTIEPGTRFLVAAQMSDEHGALEQGGSATIGLPDGLEVVGGPSTLAVGPTPAGAATTASWLVQARRPGTFIVTVQAHVPGSGTTDVGSGSRVIDVAPRRDPTLWQRILGLIPGLRP